jgi:hypothetical protein
VRSIQATHEGFITNIQVRRLSTRHGIESPTAEEHYGMVDDLAAAGRSHFIGSGTEIGELMKLEAKWRRDPANST